MQFELTEDQAMILDMVKRFAADQIAPNAHAWSEGHEDASRLWAALGELGLMSASVPEELGGIGLTAHSTAMMLEELARADVGVALVFMNHLIAVQLLSSSEHLTPEMLSGESLVALAHAPSFTDLDELGACDVFALGALDASHVVLFGGEYCQLVDLKGAKLETAGSTLGIRSARAAVASLQDQPSRKFTAATSAADLQRMFQASCGVGVGQAALDAAGTYAVDRKQFGRRLADFQVTQFKLATMATELDAARGLTMRACLEAGPASSALAAQARSWSTRVAMFVADEAVQLHGGYGYTREYDVERYYRDAKWLCGMTHNNDQLDALAGRTLLGARH